MTTSPDSPGFHDAPKDAGTLPGAGSGNTFREYLIPVALAVVITIFLWLVSTYNFALYHTTVEFATIAISVAIFLLVWKSRKIIDNHYLLFIGFTLIFIAVLDFLHTLVYQGVGIFPDGGGTLSTRFWIAARYMQAVTLLAAPLFIRRKLRLDIVAIVYLAADIIIVSSILIFHNFPVTYIPETGLTPFKVISEYIISLLLIGSILLLYRNRASFDRQVLNNLIIAIFLTIAAELTFTEYASFTDIFSLLGHVFRLVSYYFFYRAIIEVGQEKPYNLLYRNLTESEKKYRALSDLSPDAILVVQDGVIRYTNEAGIRMSGVPAPELIGRQLEDFVHPDDRETSASRFNGVQNELVISPLRELKIIASGRTTPVEATACPISWEGNHAAQVVIRDITARKKTEDELIQKNIDLNALNEELTATQDELQQKIDELTRSDSKLRETTGRLETLYSSMNEGLAIQEIVYTGGEAADYVILDVNPAYEVITGIKKADAVNRKASDLYGTGKAPFLDVYARVAAGKGPERFETYFPPMEKYFEISVFSPASGTFATVFSDITERKRAGEALQEAHRRTATILGGIADTFYTLDTQWRFTAINPAAEKAPFGRPAAELLGKVIWDLYPALVGTRIHQYYLDAAKNHSMEHYEAQSPLNRRWYEVFMQGRDSGLDVYMRDITKRKQAEEALERSNLKLSEVLDSIQDDFYVLDRSWNFVFASRQFTGRIGKEPGDFIGKNLWELFPDHIGTELEENFRTAMEKREIQRFELHGRYTDAWYNMTVFPSWEGITVLGTDVSERRRAEEALRQSEALARERSDELTLLMDAVPAAVWIAHDPRALHITGNAISDTWLDIPRGGEASKSAPEGTKPDTFRVFKDGRELPPSEMPVQISAGGIEIRNFEFDLVYPDGTVRNVLGNSTPLRNADGSSRGSVSSFIDITDRKRAEEELRRQHEDLNTAYEEIASTQEELQQNLDELSSREIQLQEALAEKEVLLSEIHHRVKNNLTAFISLLGLEGSYDDSPAGLALKKDLQNRARSMALIHETLYRTHRFSSVDMDVYLSTLTEQIVNSYNSTKAITLTVHAKGMTIDLARATPAGLIINELVTNSLKYAFPASFDCEKIRGTPCTIEVVLSREYDTCTLTVKDNGIGLPAGFDITTTKTLGLKLANFLARHQMRAEIAVDTKNGTAFVFRFNDPAK